MSRRTLLRFVFFALAHALPWSSPLAAQSLPQTLGCSADTASDDQMRVAAITIDSIELREEPRLPEVIRTNLAAAIKSVPIPADSDLSTDRLDALVQQRTRDFLQDQGFFAAVVESTAGLIRAELHQLHYWVTVEANLGLQYHLGKLEFKNAPGFPSSLLRSQFTLQTGDLFRVSKIHEGLEAIKKLYGSQGRIDAVFEAQTKIDQSERRVDLLITVDSGPQYRLRNLDIRGLDASAANFLRSKVEPGHVFDSAAWGELFEKGESHLPLDFSPGKNVAIRRDLKDGVVDIFIDYQPCRKT